MLRKPALWISVTTNTRKQNVYYSNSWNIVLIGFGIKNKIMKRSEIFNDLLESITPEMEKNWKQQRIERKNNLTSEYQLGYYVGEYIVSRFLPTLSTDMIKSRRVITVSEEDTEENKRLDSEWVNTKRPNEEGSKDKWDLFYQHNKMLEKKYLPNPLICHLGTLNILNMDEFKKGLSYSLWDCDICSYNIEPENIKIYDDEEVRFTIVELKLGE